MNKTNKRLSSAMIRLIALIAVGCASSACVSNGKMTIEETFYLAVPSGENTNFFRVKVTATSEYGVATYDSSWFPADAVDRLYGATSDVGAAAALKTEEDLKAQLNQHILAVNSGYWAAAADPTTDPEVIESWLVAQRRVRSIAGEQTALPSGAIEIEYDPIANLALRHAGQKLVFVLSSDPTQVINAISTFSQDTKTSATVLRLADVIRQQTVNQIAETEARNEAMRHVDSLVVVEVDSALARLEGETDVDALRQTVRALQVAVESLQ